MQRTGLGGGRRFGNQQGRRRRFMMPHTCAVQAGSWSIMAATIPVDQTSAGKTSPPVAAAFDLSDPPVIEGFTPFPRSREEGFKDKFIRKTKENPFVPIGCLGTAGALIYGLRAFKQGKTHQSQMLMRTRIFAQGFTVVAIIVGVAAAALKPKQ